MRPPRATMRASSRRPLASSASDCPRPPSARTTSVAAASPPPSPADTWNPHASATSRARAKLPALTGVMSSGMRAAPAIQPAQQAPERKDALDQASSRSIPSTRPAPAVAKSSRRRRSSQHAASRGTTKARFGLKRTPNARTAPPRTRRPRPCRPPRSQRNSASRPSSRRLTLPTRTSERNGSYQSEKTTAAASAASHE